MTTAAATGTAAAAEIIGIMLRLLPAVSGSAETPVSYREASTVAGGSAVALCVSPAAGAVGSVIKAEDVWAAVAVVALG